MPNNLYAGYVRFCAMVGVPAMTEERWNLSNGDLGGAVGIYPAFVAESAGRKRERILSVETVQETATENEIT